MLSSLRVGQDTCDNQGTKILIFMWGIAIHPKLSVTMRGFIIDLHLASETSKNNSQQEVLQSAMKQSETNV